MSYTSDFELKARKSMAMTILNNLRKELKVVEINKDKVKFSYNDKELDILKNAVELCKEKRENNFSPKMIIYSTRGLGGADKGAAVQIYETLDKAIKIENKEKHKSYNFYIDLMSRFLSAPSSALLTSIEKEDLRSLISTTMNIIAKSQKVSNQPDF